MDSGLKISKVKVFLKAWLDKKVRSRRLSSLSEQILDSGLIKSQKVEFFLKNMTWPEDGVAVSVDGIVVNGAISTLSATCVSAWRI